MGFINQLISSNSQIMSNRTGWRFFAASSQPQIPWLKTRVFPSRLRHHLGLISLWKPMTFLLHLHLHGDNNTMSMGKAPLKPWCWNMNPNICPCPKSSSFVVKYTSIMEHLGHNSQMNPTFTNESQFFMAFFHFFPKKTWHKLTTLNG